MTNVEGDARFESVTGRYVYLTIEEVEYRLYFEEAGAGIPILMQHTAGANGSQWRHQLKDPELQQRFHLIAYDLPFHGKSWAVRSAVIWPSISPATTRTTSAQ
jgi:pimeloyl-ACP methyl ester carboxylesterase